MSAATVGSRAPRDSIVLIAGMGTSPAVQTSYYNKWSEVCKISMWRTSM